MGLTGMSGCSRLSLSERLEIRKSPLRCFEYYSSGGITGGYNFIIVDSHDENSAIITTTNAGRYFEGPRVSEYLASIDILKDIEIIFRKYNIQNWDNKKFTNMFIADGVSHDYSFIFGEGHTKVSFSSQSYPQRYLEKLNQIHEVIKKYIDPDKLLPGLVLEKHGEEMLEGQKPTEDTVRFKVCGYYNDCLFFRVLNNLKEDITLSDEIKLYRQGGDTPILEVTTYCKEQVSPRNRYEKNIKVNERLAAGKYLLKMGEYETEFEIR